MHSIGIDIGTTSICAVKLNLKSGEIIECVTAPNNSFIHTDKEYEKIQDCESIYGTVINLLEPLCDKDTKAIGISNQMHGVLYTDKNARALSPLYTWQDGRGSLEYKNNKTYAEVLGAPSGYGLVTDFYNRENSLVPRDTEYIMTIGDYIALRLCGKAKPTMHITNAASLGLFDIKENRFKAQIPYLPNVTAEAEIIGEYKSIPVTSALGDNQASFIGSVRDDSFALINVGTGSQISMLTNSFEPKESIEFRPFDGKKYLAAGCALCGGRAFSMAERFLASAVKLATGKDAGSLYPEIDKALTEKHETTLKCDSRFCGTRQDPKLRGSFYNIDENNLTAEDMLFAVLDGMAQELFDMYSSLGRDCSALVCSGNGIRKNRALENIVKQKFGKKILKPLYKEEAAYGAALTASVAAGIFGGINEARKLIKYEGER